MTVKKPYVDPVKYPDWVDVRIRLSPEILKKAQVFTKKHQLIMSQMVNSAVKVFISEAEEYLEEQSKLKGDFLKHAKPPKNQKPFRFTSSFATPDAVNALHLKKEGR